MGRLNLKQKTWNVILFSGAKDSVKKLHIKKSKVIFILLTISTLLFIIAGSIYLIFHEKNIDYQALNEELKERDTVIDEKNIEIEEARREYMRLQEEAFAVQEAIDEFKSFEEKLNEMELEMPGDVQFEFNTSEGGEGSGGLDYPYDSSINDTEDIYNQLTKIQKELPEMIEAFENTVNRLLAYEEELKTIPTIMPTEEGRITSEYGNRIDPFTGATSFHSGIDIAASINTPIYATADGEVIQASWDNDGYGNKIIIKHGNIYESIYAHLNRIDVSVGDKVKKGEKIGGVGTTGRSTGMHLHYEIKRYGEYINPYLFMTFHDQ